MIIAAIGIMQTMENTEEEESQLASSKTESVSAGKSNKNKDTLSSLQGMQSKILSLFSGEFLVHAFSFGATRAAAKRMSVQ